MKTISVFVVPERKASIQRIAQAAGDPAGAVQSVETKERLMRRDLKHRVGGRVADRHARAEVGQPEVRDDVGAGCVPVAENAGQVGFGELIGEEVRGIGYILADKVA